LFLRKLKVEDLGIFFVTISKELVTTVSDFEFKRSLFGLQKMPEMERRDNETGSRKFWTKAKEEPFVPVGIVGTLAMIGYGVYDFKNRGSISASVYIMEYRVKAQSVIVGAMTLGVTYHLLREYFAKKNE